MDNKLNIHTSVKVKNFSIKRDFQVNTSFKLEYFYIWNV